MRRTPQPQSVYRAFSEITNIQVYFRVLLLHLRKSDFNTIWFWMVGLLVAFGCQPQIIHVTPAKSDECSAGNSGCGGDHVTNTLVETRRTFSRLQRDAGGNTDRAHAIPALLKHPSVATLTFSPTPNALPLAAGSHPDAGTDRAGSIIPTDYVRTLVPPTPVSIPPTGPLPTPPHRVYLCL
jgi:hypothetical protein